MKIPGPKPKSADMKEFEGNPGHRAIEEDVKSASGRPTTPEHLDEVGKACFDCICNTLENDLGGIKKADWLIIMLCADALRDYLENRKALQLPGEDRVLYSDKGTRYINPRVNMDAMYAKKLKSLCDELSLTATSRIRIKNPGGGKQKTSKSKFFDREEKKKREEEKKVG
jgi:P27 family predicted phage terminase small subunit